MKVYNLIWGFSLGAGIDKCYLTYDKLFEVDESIEVHSVCINLLNLKTDLKLLEDRGVTIINIKKQLDFSWVNKLSESIRESDPDVIFAHGFNGAIMMLFLRLLKGVKIPVVCSYHGLYHAPTPKKKVMEPIFNGLTRFYYKTFAERVICVENMSRDFLIRKGINKEKVVTVYNGLAEVDNMVSVDLKKFNVEEKKITILTASRISEVKGLPFLLKAIKDLKQKTEIPFQYVMIGDGPDLESLKTLASELSIGKDVHFLGYQNNIAGWLEKADIFALPSLAEYHSIALLEAMRAGKAIVATNVGGNSESVRDGKEGILVPSRNVKKLSSALLKLIENHEIRLKYGKEAKERFENNFSEDKMKENIIRVLKL